MLFVALGTNAVAEAAVGMASDVVFDAVPIVLVVANLPTAERQLHLPKDGDYVAPLLGATVTGR